VVRTPGSPEDQLFGDIKTANLVAEYENIATEYNIPVMAQFHGFDTEAQKTMRFPITNKNIEKAMIKVKLDQSERFRALLGNGVVNENDQYKAVIKDGLRLAREVVTRTKVAKNEVLATGAMTIKENNLDLTVDYGVPQAHKALTLDFGAGAAKTIPEQILDIAELADGKGATINGMYMSKRTLLKLRQNKDIQKMLGGAMMVGAIISQAALENWLSTEYGINKVLLNDYQYSLPLKKGADGKPETTMRRYYPADKVTFFAATGVGGHVGTGIWGDPPELDVQRLLQSVGASAVHPYVYITQWAEHDPSVLWTKASTLFIPVLYNPNSLYIASVTETAA
jgi:hypothetical protein